MLYEHINHFFWPFLRILALFSAAPIFNEKEVNKRVKITIAMVITLLIAPELPDTGIAIASLDGFWVGCQQIIIGICIGFSIQLIFVAVRHAGEIIGLQMGLSFAMFYDPDGSQNIPVIARLFNVLITLLFLIFNGHLYLIEVVAESFHTFPISAGPIEASGFISLMQSGGIVFSYGLMLGLPIVALLLCINMALGLLNRLTPQLSIFVIGFPLSLTGGMLALSMIVYTLPSFFDHIMVEIFNRLDTILREFR